MNAVHVQHEVHIQEAKERAGEQAAGRAMNMLFRSSQTMTWICFLDNRTCSYLDMIHDMKCLYHLYQALKRCKRNVGGV
jgi:hypothetical protein